MANSVKRVPIFRVVRPDAAVPRELEGAVAAIGNFDGVHRGHRTVIDTAIKRAQARGRPAIAVTFEPHPRTFFQPDKPLFRLTDEAAKLRLLAVTGLDGAVVLVFDAALAALSAEAFVESVLMQRLAVAGVVVGYNFHFGQGREGSPEYLGTRGARLGFSVDVLQPLESNGRPVSSSAIREALAEGRVADAADLLGYPWFVSGTVMHGEKRGRGLGYPTANIMLDPACGLRHGIYAARVSLGDRRHEAIASFGRRPTFDNGAPLLEVFLFDFSGDLYGLTLDVAFIDWIRPELRFDDVEVLVRQMKEDSQRSRAALARAPNAFPPI
jgi:riboflavin kinase / FMN adenylyltransferase